MAKDAQRVTIGRLLADKAIERGLNGSAAAEWIGTSQQNWSRWVNGTNQPGPEFVPRVAQFLGVTQAEVRKVIGPRVRAVSTAQRLDRIETEIAELKALVLKALAR